MPAPSPSTAYRSPCAAAKSSVLPASPATASGNWSRCWPASARPKAARSASAAISIMRAASRCAGGMSVADNIAFREFDRAPFAKSGWCLNRSAFRKDATRKIGLYKIKTRTPDTPISALSGGNVQRAVLARELGGEVEVLIAANPCFGLDFAAVAQIHAEIMAARNRGAAVLLVSEDLDELLELSDRLVVMFHGQFVHEARASEANLTEIGRHMAGH